MVSQHDYAARLEQHPLVKRAQARQFWNGSWLEILLTTGLWNDWRLDDRLMTENRELPAQRQQDVIDFHKRHKLRMPVQQNASNIPTLLVNQPTIRVLLNDYLNSFRMTAQPVMLQDVVPVPVFIDVKVTVHENYFQSEVKREIERALGRGPTGFFLPGRLSFGQDIITSAGRN